MDFIEGPEFLDFLDEEDDDFVTDNLARFQHTIHRDQAMAALDEMNDDVIEIEVLTAEQYEAQQLEQEHSA